MKLWCNILTVFIIGVLFQVENTLQQDSVYRDISSLSGTSSRSIRNYTLNELPGISKLKCLNLCSANQKCHAVEVNSQICRLLIQSPGLNDTFSSNLNRRIYAKIEKYNSIIPTESQSTLEPTSIANLIVMNSFKLNQSSYPYYPVLSLINDLLIVGHIDGYIEIWNPFRSELKFSLKNNTAAIRGIFPLDNQKYITVSEDKSISIWSVSGVLVNKTYDNDAITSADLYNQEILANGLSTGFISIWNITTLNRTRAFFTIGANSFNVIKFIDNELILVSQILNLYLYNIKNNAIVKYFTGHGSQVYGISLLGDNIFASSSNDKSIRIWNITTANTLRVLNGHTNTVNPIVKFNTEYLISGSYDSTIKIWNLKNGNQTFSIKFLEQVRALVMVNSSYLISGSTDGLISVLRMS